MIEGLTADTRWLLGGITSIAIVFGGFQLRQGSQIASMSANIEQGNKALTKLAGTVEDLIKIDLSDMKSRIAIMEAKEILPQAQQRISELDARIRELERSSFSNGTHKQ